MKLKIILFILFFIFQENFSQDKIWETYDLDSIVSLEMPFTVYELDSIDDHHKIYQIYTDSTSSNFISQKIYSKIKSKTLPTNEKSLKKYYSDLIEVFNIMYENELSYSKEIKNNNLTGCTLVFKNNDNLEVLETNLFYVNKNLYSFIYFDKNGLNKDDRETFFNSIFFNDEYELLQYSKKKMSFTRKIILSLFGLLFISFVLRFKTKRKKVFNKF